MVDVQAACSHVSRHEQVDCLVAQAIHDAIALILREPSVQSLCLVAAGRERLGEIVDFASGAAEDDRCCGVLGIEDAHDGRGLVEALDDVRGLADAGHVVGTLGGGRDGDPLGIAQVLARQLVDALGHRRGEEHRLARLRGLGEQGLDVLDESHLEHLIGFVEHDRAHVTKLE